MFTTTLAIGWVRIRVGVGVRVKVRVRVMVRVRVRGSVSTWRERRTHG